MAEIGGTAVISADAPNPPKVSLRRSLGLSRFHFVFGGLVRDARAGVMMLMAISLFALATATGVGIDFARAVNFKSGLQAPSRSECGRALSNVLCTLAQRPRLSKRHVVIDLLNGIGSSPDLRWPWAALIVATKMLTGRA
jgi:hypothetical protein